MGWAMADHLILGLLASCEPLHKLRQANREGSLDWFVGNPQPLSQPLKVPGSRDWFSVVWVGRGNLIV